MKKLNDISTINWNKRQRFYAKVLKRALDIFFGVLLFILFVPIFALTALVIRAESKGNAIFKQERLGQNGKIFWIYKFRSMVVGAEKQGSGVYSFKGDARVTNVGKFIRKTSIDEIPQLVNIIKGEMSFVGPRPTLTYHPWQLEKYTDFQKQRFIVKPGVTGLAQINGRKELEWSKRLAFDVAYINKISFWQDIKLMVRTGVNIIKMQDNVNVSKTAK